MEVDSTAWSGEGTFTQIVLEKLRRMEDVVAIRVEDAPSTRSEADYNFVSNEIFVRFEMRSRKEPGRRFGFLPATRVVTEKALSLADLAGRLAGDEDVGPADYSDEGMVQYLRTERIIPPYQTRGYKLVELLRIYETDQSAQTNKSK
ncbi:MAG TPA: hypothetical protein VH702_19805 [Vicinamibacterales bacterium]|jgi:hypothetical protein